MDVNFVGMNLFDCRSWRPPPLSGGIVVARSDAVGHSWSRDFTPVGLAWHVADFVVLESLLRLKRLEAFVWRVDGAAYPLDKHYM